MSPQCNILLDPDSGNHVCAKWHKSSTKKHPRRSNTPPSGTSTLWWCWFPSRTMCAATSNKLLSDSQRNVTKSLKHDLIMAQIQIWLSYTGCAWKIVMYWVLLAWGSLLYLKQYLGGFYRTKHIHINTRAQGFPQLWSMSFTLSGSGFNVVADCCHNS